MKPTNRAPQYVETDLTPGTRILYILPKKAAHGRPTELRLPGTVITRTRRRIVIRLDTGTQSHRNVLPRSLVRMPPA